MRSIIITAIIAAILAFVASCTGKPAPIGEAPAAEEETIAELTDEADSLGYYMGLSMAETIRTAMAKDSTLLSADPAKVAEGLRASLAVPGTHPGYEYGAQHGASLQLQLALFRSVDIHVSPAMVVAGLRNGINADPADKSGTEALDKLMTPVNNKLIMKMMRERR